MKIFLASMLGLILPLHEANAYNLFHPTPKSQMRKMTMDRPDTIETPHSVDAGHFQIEASLFSYAYDANTVEGNTVTNNYSVLPMLLKVGLLDWCDLELGLQPYVHNQQRDVATSIVTKASGFGDILLRFKAALYGNNEGRFLLATIPLVVFPTSQDGTGNNRYEAGIIFPMEFELSEAWSLAAETQYNYVENVSGRGHAAEFINIVSVGHDFTEKFGMFAEFFTQVRHEIDFPWVTRFDTGFTYALNENFVIDGAVNIGLTKAAEDVNPFVGFSLRY